MYLSYSQYGFWGGTLEEATFNRLEFRARKFVDGITFGRVKSMTTVPEAVQRLVYELVGIGNQDDHGGAVTGMSNDGYSESYATVNNEEKAQSLAYYYLSQEKDENDVPLLYRGVI